MLTNVSARQIGDRVVTAYGNKSGEEFGYVFTEPDSDGWYDVMLDGGVDSRNVPYRAYRLLLNDDRAILAERQFPECEVCHSRMVPGEAWPSDVVIVEQAQWLKCVRCTWEAAWYPNVGRWASTVPKAHATNVSFEDWMAAVEAEIEDGFGMAVTDLPDRDWRKVYASSVSPALAVEQAFLDIDDVPAPADDVAYVLTLPACAMCALDGVEEVALYDAKTKAGPWAYMCQRDFDEMGVGLGTGLGQRLVQQDPE